MSRRSNSSSSTKTSSPAQFAFDSTGTRRKDDPDVIQDQKQTDKKINKYSLSGGGGGFHDHDKVKKMTTEHRALQAWMGYGPSAEHIGTESIIRNDVVSTNSPHRKQTKTRTFLAVPNLARGEHLPNIETRLQNGQDTQTDKGPGSSTVSEKQFPVFHPEMRPVRVENLIPDWTRGGASSRDETRNPDFLKSMGYEKKSKGVWAKVN